MKKLLLIISMFGFFGSNLSATWSQELFENFVVSYLNGKNSYEICAMPSLGILKPKAKSLLSLDGLWCNHPVFGALALHHCKDIPHFHTSQCKKNAEEAIKEAPEQFNAGQIAQWYFRYDDTGFRNSVCRRYQELKFFEPVIVECH